jgi:hypothetical protein
MTQNGNGSLDRLAANLRSLAQDLDEIVSGARPTAADLSAAPIILDWVPRLTRTQGPAIRGTVVGHPLIADGEMFGAEILAVDPDLRWIMSWAGYYRLGAQASERPAKPDRRRASA